MICVLIRPRSVPATGAGSALALAALAGAALGSSSIVVILIATLLLNLAIQGVGVSYQTRLLTIRPELRNRLNTAFVF